MRHKGSSVCMTLEYPTMRDELVEYLQQLTNPHLCRPGHSVPDSLDYAVHFLFDDTPLADDPQRAVGYFLLNADEADVVSRVIEALDRLFQIYGTERSDRFYVRQSEWESVRSAAERALEVLLVPDR